MKLFSLLLLWGCSDKTDTLQNNHGGDIVVGPPPEPINDDTAVTDTASPEDTGLEDTGTEDSAVADSGIDDSGDLEPAMEDTAVELQRMPDFSLPDVNPYSPSLGSIITVRDQLQSISGWYFIKAT